MTLSGWQKYAALKLCLILYDELNYVLNYRERKWWGRAEVIELSGLQTINIITKKQLSPAVFLIVC